MNLHQCITFYNKNPIGDISQSVKILWIYLKFDYCYFDT